MKSRGNYQQLTLKQKLNIIEEVDKGKKRKDIAAKFNIKANTLTSIYQKKASILQQIQNNGEIKSKRRVRKGKFIILNVKNKYYI